MLEITRDLSASVARRYPPAVYNNGEDWNQSSFEELAQDVIVDRLLGERQLEYLFDTARDIETFRRLLIHQVRRTLSHRRSRTVVDRLLQRTRALVSASPFVTSTVGRELWICLEENVTPYRSAPEPEIRAAADTASRIPRLMEHERSERASMVYTTSSLKGLLELVVRELGGLSERDLAKIFEVLLTSWLPTFLERPEDHHLPTTEAADGRLEALNMTETVRSFEETLDDVDRTVLLCKSQDISDHDVAERLGRSRPWVADRKSVVFARVGEEVMADLPTDLHSSALRLLLSEISSRITDAEQ